MNGVSQANIAAYRPVAPKKNHKAGKVILGTLATAAVVATGLAVGAKKGTFVTGIMKLAEKNATVNNKFLAKVITVAGDCLRGMDKAGNFIGDKAGVVVNAIKNNGIAEKAGKFVKETIPEYAKKGVDFVKNLIKPAK